jgi:hypothetical protein
MQTHIRIAEILTELLESKFQIGKFRFGLDPLLGIMPILGDIIPVAVSFYMVWIGRRMKLPEESINRMIQNIVIDFIIGIVPFFGDIGDFVFKANTKNLAILKAFTKQRIIDGEVVS